MNATDSQSVTKATDGLQQQLTNYAFSLSYSDLPSEVVHAAKVRIIDTLGALMAGFFGEPCRIARNVAALMPNRNGATVIGTRMKTMIDMAAFANATASRYAEMNDTYHSPGSFGGHPSEAVTPILAVAEHAQVGGREFLTAVVLGYEVYLRINDVFHGHGFDHTNFDCLSAAIAGGKLLGLSQNQLSHCISMAVVPNVCLRQVRRDHLTMFKAAAPGQAGRSGVFAALLAQVGMEGPHLPFEGKSGWLDHVAGERFSLKTWGGNGTPFKISGTRIKLRIAADHAIASVLATEKVAPLKDIRNVNKVTVEIYKMTGEHTRSGPGEPSWNPNSRETADYSIPYNVAVTLMEGTVTRRSFDDAHLWNPEIRDLMQKVEVVENDEFTRAYERLPVEYRARVSIVLNNGERLVGETGGDKEDLGAPKSDTQIVEKFRGLTEDLLGKRRVDSILDRLWHLEDLKDMAEIPPVFALD